MPVGSGSKTFVLSSSHSSILPVFLVSIFLLLLGCNTEQNAGLDTFPDITAQLQPGAGLSDIAAHLVKARRERATTRALALYYPDLDRVSGYRIQMMTLATEEQAGHTVAGWKMGGTRVTDPNAAPDPQFGYSLDSNVYPANQPFPVDSLTVATPMVESEIAVWIGRDLPDPDITIDEFLEAVQGISGGVEIISSRLRPTDQDHPESLTTAHALADDISHGAAILGTKQVDPATFDFDNEEAWIEINGEVKARGTGRAIMGKRGNPLDAVFWLAKELPRHGHHLRKGQFVITGSLYDNPTMKAGDSAVVHYSSLGTIKFSMRSARQ
ncbi:MAG: fumarylacetoacetate hydrolase family protein [Calditrichota bacterium]